MTERIESIEFQPLSVPLKEPFRIALGTQESLSNVLVKVVTTGGTVGVGEMAPFPTVTGETQGTAMAAGKFAKDLLQGRRLEDYRGIVQDLRTHLGAQSAARAGIEIAVFDALGRAWGVSMKSLFGGRDATVKTDDTIGIISPVAAAEAAESAVTAGFHALKIKIGTTVTDDVARVAAVREAAPHSKLKVDANQGYSVKQAIEFADQVHDRGLNIELLEQPVQREDLVGLRRVTEAVSCRVAADESVFTPTDAARVADAAAADVINIKVMKSGLAGAVDIISIAESYNLELMIGCMVESSIGIMAGAHLVAGTDAFSFVDLDGHFMLESDVVDRSYAPELPVLGPGLGLEVDVDGL